MGNVLFNKGQSWTRQQDDDLASALTAGATLEELCRKFGRTPAAILSRLTARGLVTQVRKGFHKVDPDPWVLTYIEANYLALDLEREDKGASA